MEVNYKHSVETLRAFENKYKFQTDAIRERIKNGDIQTNINDLLDSVKRNLKDEINENIKLYYSMLYYWILFRFGIDDNFKIWRAYLMHCLDEETDINRLKEINSSIENLNLFVTDNGIESVNDLTLKYLELETQDLIIGESKKSTKLFKNSIDKLNIKGPGLSISIDQKGTLNDELNAIINSENQFCKGLPMGKVVSHFDIFTKRKSRNGDVFLTSEQFISFLKRGFLNDTSEPRQTINYSNTEKGLVILRFYEFYDMAVSHYQYPAKTEKFTDLIEYCFDNWDEKSIKAFFKKGKTKRYW